VVTIAGGLLVPEVIIHPVVSGAALTRFIRYTCIHYWDLQFLYNVIIIKAKILLLHAYVTSADFNYPT